MLFSQDCYFIPYFLVFRETFSLTSLSLCHCLLDVFFKPCLTSDVLLACALKDKSKVRGDF